MEENIGTGPIIQAFERQQNDYENNRVGRLLLSYIDAQQRGNETLRAIDKQLKGPLLLLLQRSSYPSHWKEEGEQQAVGLIVKVAERQ